MSSQQLIVAPPYNPSDIPQGLKTPSSKMSRLTKYYSSPSVLPRIEEFTTPNQPGALSDLTSVVERQRKKERKSRLSSRPSSVQSGYISAPETYSNMFLRIYKLHQDTMLDILQRQRQRQSRPQSRYHQTNNKQTDRV